MIKRGQSFLAHFGQREPPIGALDLDTSMETLRPRGLQPWEL